MLRQLDDLSRYLAACQLGITFTSLGIGFLGEPAVADVLEGMFGDGPAGRRVVRRLDRPRVPDHHVAAHHGRRAGPEDLRDQPGRAHGARWIARPLHLFTQAFNPFIHVLNTASNWMLRLLGIKATNEYEEGGSPEELKVLIAQSLTGGQLDPGEASMLTGVFHLHEQQARQVMTPAPAVITVDLSENVETALRRCVSSGHTRVVVTEDENRDRVKGIVHSNALAQLLLTEGPSARIDELVREAPIVPETKPLDDLLADLQRQRSSLAVVIDEYGRTAGIVTVEDIIEEVVGEIDDETDPMGGAVRRLANGDWFVRGHVAITDLVDYGLALPGRLRRLQLGRRLRVRRARAAAQARRHGHAQRLLDPRRVRAREPDRGGPHPRPPRAALSASTSTSTSTALGREAGEPAAVRVHRPAMRRAGRIACPLGTATALKETRPRSGTGVSQKCARRGACAGHAPR